MFLDLCDARWRAIEITSEGWWVDPNPTVRFLRSNQLPLPEPERGASIDLLRDLVHLASDDDFKLVVGWLLGALQPIGPFPILAILGEHGSGKSSAARMIQQLVDPHKAGLRAEPKSVDDLIVGAKQTRVLGFDNISHIQPWLSDALCRLATGGALTKRQLYTNDEEVILNTTNAVLISAIPEVITRSDLLDRTLKVSTSVSIPGIGVKKPKLPRCLLPSLRGSWAPCLPGSQRPWPRLRPSRSRIFPEWLTGHRGRRLQKRVWDGSPGPFSMPMRECNPLSLRLPSMRTRLPARC
jgi:hypothetical protein